MTRTSLPTLLFNLGLITCIFANPVDDSNGSRLARIVTKNEVNLEISMDICRNNDFCKCQYKRDVYEVSCKCNDESQIINLMGYEAGDKRKLFLGKTSWTIERCHRVVVTPKAFSAVNGEYFDLRLMNLSSTEIREEAFELISVGSAERHMRKITLEHVNIEKLPAKTFPSSLNELNIKNSNIGIISSRAFSAYNINQIAFTNAKVGTIEEDAFLESLLIDSWLVSKSNFTNIRGKGVASSVTNMTWIDSRLEHLESSAFGGVIVNASFKGNYIGIVETNGLTLKDWTWISYVNNTFGLVNYSGIDLSTHSSANFNVTEFSGNLWTQLQPNFILTTQSDSVLAIVRNNRLMEPCICGRDIISKLLKTAGSNSKFYEEFRNNSKCYTTRKGAKCIDVVPDFEDEKEKVFIPYPLWQSLCNETVDQCIQEIMVELPSVYSTPSPTSPSRIRLLLILIGSVGFAIVICLVAVMMVYLCRRANPITKTSPMSRSTHSDLAKVLSKGSSMSYADIVNQSESSSNGVNTSSRPRSAIFEDVEMEDKGVQTMPSELSSDVLEGLRAKLSHPDSFWDAKETIDHLYDLIHVRETPPLSSPPDVTMLCKATDTNPAPYKSNANNISTSSSTKLSRTGPVTPRYAQIRSKLRTAPICEYGDPSDSQMHIYSELSSNQANHANNRQSTGTQAYLCEYTEPKDVQTHVYAELNSAYPQGHPQDIVENGNVVPSTSFLQSQRFKVSSTLPNANVQTPKGSMSTFQSQILDSSCPSTPPCQQRPLPSIPPRSNL